MSCSGSETSTDISTSSLENLSTSARQEPQGEETADLTSGLLDADGASTTLSLTSLGPADDDVDGAKSWLQSGATAAGSGGGLVLATTSGQLPSQQACSQSSGVSSHRPVVSAGAANSLIRQLLQTSPQYSHLLSDLDPVCAGGGGGAPSGTVAETKSSGSPRSVVVIKRLYTFSIFFFTKTRFNVFFFKFFFPTLFISNRR